MLFCCKCAQQGIVKSYLLLIKTSFYLSLTGVAVAGIGACATGRFTAD